MEEIGKIHEVRTHILGGCPVCGNLPARVDLDSMEDIAPRVNHTLEVHGLRLLHVGQQTGTATNGEPFIATVAVLGSRTPRNSPAEPRLQLPLLDPQ